MKSNYDLGSIAYAAYCVQAGGKTFDGKPLPTWYELGNERRLCWSAAAVAITKEINKELEPINSYERFEHLMNRTS